MKTRSGVTHFPAESDWPSVYQAREHIPEINTGFELRRVLYAIVMTSMGLSMKKRRLCFLIMAEMLLKYHTLLSPDGAQTLIDRVISNDCIISKDREPVDFLSEYTQQFKVLSDHHRLEAKRAYFEFLLTGPLNRDVAHHIASMV